MSNSHKSPLIKDKVLKTVIWLYMTIKGSPQQETHIDQRIFECCHKKCLLMKASLIPLKYKISLNAVWTLLKWMPFPRILAGARR